MNTKPLAKFLGCLFLPSVDEKGYFMVEVIRGKNNTRPPSSFYFNSQGKIADIENKGFFNQKYISLIISFLEANKILFQHELLKQNKEILYKEN